MWSDLKKESDGWWIYLRQSKTAEGLEPVPIGSAVAAELMDLPKRGLYVFATASSTPYNSRNLTRDWHRALRRAELPPTNLYQLRKLFGTEKASRGVQDTVLASSCGERTFARRSRSVQERSARTCVQPWRKHKGALSHAVIWAYNARPQV